MGCCSGYVSLALHIYMSGHKWSQMAKHCCVKCVQIIKHTNYDHARLLTEHLGSLVNVQYHMYHM